MKFASQLLAPALVAAAVSFGISHFGSDAGPQTAGSAKESVYERVMRTGTLRCGYVTFVPNVMKDPATGALSGLDVDVAAGLERLLGIKVEWTAEVGWATTVTSIESGKVDAICNGYWINPATGKQALFSTPYYYQPLFVVARTDDTRFDSDLGAINRPDITIAALDHDNGKFIAEADFPAAKLYLLPDMSGMGALYESIALHKGDVTFADAYSVGDYNANNTERQVRATLLGNPVRIYPVGYILPKGDAQMKSMIDTALHEMIYSGEMGRIMDKYEKYPNSFIRVPRPQ
ncbi:MAG: transporter substrate-binding domain-containing protein [Alphaproteobacteria bacterium]|nr:transporter substrate-binding domain-containing protein [Alphaproteobacteria bacterium]